MASTLADFSKLEKDTLRKSVIDGLLFNCDVMQFIPWETIGALGTKVTRFQLLPSVGFRSIGEGYSEATGKTEQIPEDVSFLGGNIDVDKALIRANNTIAKERAVQQQMKLKAMAYKFNDQFINGDRSSDPEEIDGILRRIGLLDIASSQEVDYTSGATPVATAGDALTFIEKIDEAVYCVEGHTPTFILGNQKGFLFIRQAARRASLLRTDQDQFGREISKMGSIPFYDIGVKADQSTQIITNTETKGGGSTETSLYFVKTGIGDMFWGIQEYPLETTDKGELENGVTYRTVIDWPLGLAQVDKRAMSRLFGIVTS